MGSTSDERRFMIRCWLRSSGSTLSRSLVGTIRSLCSENSVCLEIIFRAGASSSRADKVTEVHDDHGACEGRKATDQSQLVIANILYNIHGKRPLDIEALVAEDHYRTNVPIDSHPTSLLFSISTGPAEDLGPSLLRLRFWLKPESIDAT